MKIKVEQKHIDAGIRKSGNRCPIALAIQEQYPDIFPSVGTIYICWCGVFRNCCFFATFPEEAQNFIIKFDSKQSVKPFEFEMMMVEEIVQHEN